MNGTQSLGLLGNFFVIFRADVNGHDIDAVLIVIEKHTQSRYVGEGLTAEIIREADAYFGSINSMEAFGMIAKHLLDKEHHFIESLETTPDGLDLLLCEVFPTNLSHTPVLGQETMFLR
jgi:hypothetical protein